MLWNFSHFIDLSAVSDFDQQVVLCNTGRENQWFEKCSSSPDLGGISTENQDLCYSDHHGSKTNAVKMRLGDIFLKAKMCCVLKQVSECHCHLLLYQYWGPCTLRRNEMQNESKISDLCLADLDNTDMNPSCWSWWCHSGHKSGMFFKAQAPLRLKREHIWSKVMKGMGPVVENPCRPALFMYGAVKTQNFQASVGLSLTVTRQHYCHRGQILFGAKLGLCSLLFNFCTSSFTQVFILTRKYTLTCKHLPLSSKQYGGQGGSCLLMKLFWDQELIIVLP